MLDELWFWLFNATVLFLLSLDLFVFHRKAHVVGVKEALLMSGAWIAIALAFNTYIYFAYSVEAAGNFFAGYIVEKALSVDNLFVFMLIFSYFRVPPHLLHKVLFWGILGSIVLRAVFIVLGIALISQFHWLIYLFGLLLLYTGVKMCLARDKSLEPSSNGVVRLFQKMMPVTEDYVADKLFVKRSGKWLATPLFIVLLMIETTDLIFAVDSIPAIIGITQDPFIVYTSNIFAILGLRSLYFAIHGAIGFFHYLKYGLSCILIFIGSKMLLSGYISIPIVLSLGIIGSCLLLSMLASLVFRKKTGSEQAL